MPFPERMKEAGLWPVGAEEGKDGSEVSGGRVVRTGPRGGGGLASLWEQPGPGGCVICKAMPKPLDPELQPMVEGTKRNCGENRSPLKPAALSLWSQGAQALEPTDR